MNNDSFSNRDNSRDGYSPRREGGNGSGNSPRPRFSRSSRPVGSGSYSGYREDSASQRGTGGYRPQRSEGYRSGGYNSDYRRSTNQYQNRDGGYRSSYNRNDRYQGGEGGGYRPSYNKERYQGGEGGGYRSYEQEGANGLYGRPRFQSRDNEGGYRPRRFEGGNGSYERPRFQSRGGSFNGRPPRGRGGYDPHAKYSQKKRLEYKEENYDPTVPIRLNKFLANAGVCSRRDADKYIEAGVVTVNGKVITELGAKVLRTDEVKFHDNPIRIEKKVYVLLNKPKGYVTTSEDPQNRKTVMDLVKGACPERIYPVGRLDRNTTGVLLLTNDGDLASKLTHPKFLKKKIYHVTTDQNVSAGDLQRIAEGITLEDGEIKADAIEYASETDKKQVGIEIHSGKNRIVRRIFESLGYHVTKLDRVYFAGMTKKNVRRGDWRYLTEQEVQMLRMGAFE